MSTGPILTHRARVGPCLTGDTLALVDEVTVRELRNAGGEVLARVARGESLTVTRDGEPVGELRPLPRPRLTREALLTRWRPVPAIDVVAFRDDVDAVADPSL